MNHKTVTPLNFTPIPNASQRIQVLLGHASICMIDSVGVIIAAPLEVGSDCAFTKYAHSSKETSLDMYQI